MRRITHTSIVGGIIYALAIPTFAQPAPNPSPDSITQRHCDRTKDSDAIEYSPGKEYTRLTPSKDKLSHTIAFGEESRSITINEKFRDKKIVADLKVIPEIISAFDGSHLIAEPTYTCIDYQQKILQSSADLTVTTKTGEIQKTILIMGPEENLYLTADIVVTKLTQLKYDAKSAAIFEKSKPADFFIGLNYKIGDVYTNYDYRNFHKDLSAKLLINASSRPLDKIGIGLGYSFSFGEIFFARIHVKGEEAPSKWNNAIGISLNLQRAASWLNSKEQ